MNVYIIYIYICIIYIIYIYECIYNIYIYIYICIIYIIYIIYIYIYIKKSHIFPYRYISELYSFVSVCVCQKDERYMLKI